MKTRFSAVVGLLLLALVANACAGRQDELARRLDSSDDELRVEQERLGKELASLHLRLQLQADRLRQTEEELVRLRAQMTAGERPDGLNRRSESPGPVTAPAAPAPAFDAGATYARARALFGERRYDEAAADFTRIIAEAPKSPQADNAQYWIGECHYGVGRFRQALEAFKKVAAYTETEKDDDAQLKIARCHLALGQKEQAIAAFRTLVDTFPDSEYIDAARRELRYLGGS